MDVEASEWRERAVSVGEAVAAVRPGDKVFVGTRSSSTTPAITARRD